MVCKNFGRPSASADSGQIELRKTEQLKQQESAIKEIPKKLVLYVPENIDINKVLEDNPPNNDKIHRDKLLYILHLINSIPTKREDLEYELFTPLHSVLLKRRLREYRIHLDYLVSIGILLENKQYIVGKKSRGFCFRNVNPYSTIKLKEVFITKKTLIKSILKFIDLGYGEAVVGLPLNKAPDYNYLTKWYDDRLTIDYASANNYLENLFEKELLSSAIKNPGDRLRRRSLPLYKFHRGDFSPTIDRTAGRLHSTLTQLKSELRPFIRFDGEPLVAVDIVNSQPYLTCMLLNKSKFEENIIMSKVRHYNQAYTNRELQTNLLYYVSQNGTLGSQPNDVKTYIKIVSSGQFYEHFGKILSTKALIEMGEDGDLRKLAKTATFSSIFSPNNSISYNKTIKAFNKIFPNVYKILKLIKYGKGNHPTLAIILQNLEAELVLGRVCRILSEMNPDMPLFTLHDSVITTKEYVPLVHTVMTEVLTEGVGISPTLKIEKWIAGGD